MKTNFIILLPDFTKGKYFYLSFRGKLNFDFKIFILFLNLIHRLKLSVNWVNDNSIIIESTVPNLV